MPDGTESAVDDVAYLSRARYRVASLVALADGPRSRDEIAEISGVSSSTVRRMLREFEDRRWIRRDGRRYETTQLGAFVAGSMADLIDDLETERRLREVWRWLPGEEEGMTVGMFSDAVVTVAEAGDPYRPVNRFLELLRDADSFRFVGFDVALLEPCKEELCEQVIEGTSTELITPPRVAQYVRSTCPELFAEALETGRLTFRLHDDLPRYGVSIFDDRVAVSGYDPDSVTVRVLVDTDSAEAREWAESRYELYRRRTPTVPLGGAEE